MIDASYPQKSEMSNTHLLPRESVSMYEMSTGAARVVLWISQLGIRYRYWKRSDAGVSVQIDKVEHMPQYEPEGACCISSLVDAESHTIDSCQTYAKFLSYHSISLYLDMEGFTLIKSWRDPFNLSKAFVDSKLQHFIWVNFSNY